VFLTGRVLYGVGCGMLACAIPRFLDEMMPPNLMAFFGGLYTFSFSWAVIVAFMLALGLPPDTIDDMPNPELQYDEFWRVIYGLPVMFFLIQWVLLLSIFKYEPPKFLIIQLEKARENNFDIDKEVKIKELEYQLEYMISHIYEGVDSPEKVKQY
jgi:MFS family permease